MRNRYVTLALLFWSTLILTAFTSFSNAEEAQTPQVPKATSAPVKGIYLTQYALENTAFLHYLIKHAKASGIDTFVVDLELPSKRYQQNIQLLKANNIQYVARIIMFPDGGKPEAINNPAIWQKKYKLVKQAIAWGANQIQLDYIRFSSKQKASPDNAQRILAIIQWYKNQLMGQNIPLQVDVFGITSFGESKHIGQNIKLFSQAVDAICPMVYPSHYVPFAKHFQQPYETVHDSLVRIKKQFGEKKPIKIYAYIELSNYHYPMSREKTKEYIKAQLKAVDHAGADGWYAWSPHNRYDNLFSILENRNVSAKEEGVKELVLDEDKKPNKNSKKVDPTISQSNTSSTKNNEKM